MKKRSAQIERDKNGNIMEVKTSWGFSHENRYDSRGSIEKQSVRVGGETAQIAFEDRKTTRVRDFDDGRYDFSYYKDGPSAGRLKSVAIPNNLTLAYSYDSKNRITAADYGTYSRVKLDYDSRGREAGLSRLPLLSD